MKKITREKENSTEKSLPLCFYWLPRKKMFSSRKIRFTMWHSDGNFSNFSSPHCEEFPAFSLSCRWKSLSATLNDDRLLLISRAVISRASEFSLWICGTKKVASPNVVSAHCSEFINNRASRHHCSWKKGKILYTNRGEKKTFVCTIDKGLCLIVFVLCSFCVHAHTHIPMRSRFSSVKRGKRCFCVFLCYQQKHGF